MGWLKNLVSGTPKARRSQVEKDRVFYCPECGDRNVKRRENGVSVLTFPPFHSQCIPSFTLRKTARDYANAIGETPTPTDMFCIWCGEKIGFLSEKCKHCEGSQPNYL